MTRDELLDLLEVAVRRRWLTAGEAGALLAAFDAGTLDTGHLPLPLRDAIGGLGATDHERALERIAALAGIAGATDAGRRRLLRSLGTVRRGSLREAAQDTFAERVDRLVQRYAPEGRVRILHRRLRDEVRTHIVEQAQLGAGRPLTAPELRRLDRVIREQERFLARFATDVAHAQATEQPMPTGTVSSRARQYAGAGRAEFYRAKESEETGDGIVYDYVALDDDRTCAPCHDAEIEGPYLAADGPQPGDVCRGHGHCRCDRVPRFAPEAYRRLTGREAA